MLAELDSFTRASFGTVDARSWLAVEEDAGWCCCGTGLEAVCVAAVAVASTATTIFVLVAWPFLCSIICSAVCVFLSSRMTCFGLVGAGSACSCGAAGCGGYDFINSVMLAFRFCGTRLSFLLEPGEVEMVSSLISSSVLTFLLVLGVLFAGGIVLAFLLVFRSCMS